MQNVFEGINAELSRQIKFLAALFSVFFHADNIMDYQQALVNPNAFA
jgi:hypothetical protein